MTKVTSLREIFWWTGLCPGPNICHGVWHWKCLFFVLWGADLDASSQGLFFLANSKGFTVLHHHHHLHPPQQIHSKIVPVKKIQWAQWERLFGMKWGSARGTGAARKHGLIYLQTSGQRLVSLLADCYATVWPCASVLKHWPKHLHVWFNIHPFPHQQADDIWDLDAAANCMGDKSSR